MPPLSELEFALNVTVNAWHRWMLRATAASGPLKEGVAGLTAKEVLVLHQVNHRGREKTLADLCLVMNVEDTHLVNYAVKKLGTAGLVKTGRRGKEKTVSITREGEAACARYHELREALLVKSVRSLGLDETEVSRLAGLLRALSGQYDQAARAAASL